MVVPRWTGKEGGGGIWNLAQGFIFSQKKWGSPLGSSPRSTTEPILNVNILCIKMSLYKDLKHSVWS